MSFFLPRHSRSPTHGPPATLQRHPASSLHDGHYGPSRGPLLALSKWSSRVYSATRIGRTFSLGQAAIERQPPEYASCYSARRDDATEQAAGHLSEPATGP